MEEQRPAKRFHSMAPDQGARPHEVRCPGGRGRDPGGPTGPAQPSKPLAYVKPVRWEAPGFVGGAAQRVQTHRRGSGHRAERDPRAPGEPGRLLGPDPRLEPGPRQPREAEARQTQALALSRAAEAAAARALTRQELLDAHGPWALREVRPAHCAYVGFVPAGSAAIMVQTQAGVYLYSVPGAQAHPRQPPSL